MEALERWDSPASADDGLLILWARKQLLPSRPDLVGIWWDEKHDPLALSCPRGGILPERLAEFEIAGPSGEIAPVALREAEEAGPEI